MPPVSPCHTVTITEADDDQSMSSIRRQPVYEDVTSNRTYSGNERAVSDPAVGASGIVIGVGNADALLLVDSILARYVHEVAASSLWGFDHLRCPKEALSTRITNGVSEYEE